jgi:hypothetical protein
MLQKVAGVGLIKGLGNEIIEGGVISLQYVDDTILFLDRDKEKVENLKWILTYFELMSGMRMNYHKGEIIPLNMEEEEEIKNFASIFGVL